MPYSNISLITDSNLLFQQYDFIQVSHDENNYIIGRVVSYDGNSGSLTFTPLQVQGSGTYSTWNVSLSGPPGISGTSGTSTEIYGTTPNSIVKINGDGNGVDSDSNLTFDGHTLSIDPFSYSTGGNPVYRVVYHNDGTSGTAGIVVRSTVPGQPYDGIIENRVPHDYQHQFVVGDNNIAHIDAQGFHVQQALIADNGVYFQYLENDTASNKFLVWNSGTSGDLVGKVGWTTSGGAGTPGANGTSGTSGSTNLLSSVGWNTNKEYQIGNTEQLTFAGDYVLDNSDLYIDGSEENIEYAQDKFVRKIGKIYIGGNLIIKDSTIENNGEIGVGGSVILIGNSQITGTGIII